MIRSMTAFAHQESVTSEGKLSWELRTVNHRYLDVSLRLPEEFRALENNFRNQLQNRLQRGKLEASLRFTAGAKENSTIVVNEPLARALIIACRQIEILTNSPEPLRAVDILRWPGVTLDSPTDLDAVSKQATELLDKTINDLIATREREGKRIADMIDQRCEQIAELVLLAQRLDIDEELDRLLAHLDEIVAVLERDEPIGRRLDFLMQELNREANTLSSKSNDTETTQAAVDLKVLIEQMREQIQNIE